MVSMHVADGVAALAGRLDADEAPNALARLQGLDGPLTLDCAELEYISSAGLGVVVQTFKRLKAQGQDLKLVRLRPNVRNVFTYAGLHRLLQIE